MQMTMATATKVHRRAAERKKKRGGVPWSRGGIWAASTRPVLPDDEIKQKYPRYMTIRDTSYAMAVSYACIYTAWQRWLKLPLHTIARETSNGRHRLVGAVDVWLLLEFRKYGLLLPRGRKLDKLPDVKMSGEEVGRKILEDWAGRRKPPADREEGRG